MLLNIKQGKKKRLKQDANTQKMLTGCQKYT